MLNFQCRQPNRTKMARTLNLALLLGTLFRNHCAFTIVKTSAMTKEKIVGIQFVTCLAQDNRNVNGTNLQSRFTELDYG